MSETTMDWGRLLSPARFVGADREPAREERPDMRGPFLRDVDRILYSSAFRRLQQKTQVHPFPENDYVRTRLTHSLEVSSVGRSLGLEVGSHLRTLGEAALTPHELADMLAAACLAHDIGHPPFGHAGEEAIRHWFRSDRPDVLAACTAAEAADLASFESNAQGFRILTRLQFWRDRGGMQLSAATLGAFSKYPRGSLGAEEGAGAERKFGYVQGDSASFATLARHLGLLPVAGEPGAWCRHPLAFLVEAADDVCYLVVDIEDGFKSGRLRFAAVEELLIDLAGGNADLRHRELDEPDAQITYLRSRAIHRLVAQVATGFLAVMPAILAGRQPTPLLEATEAGPRVREIRELSRCLLYNDERKLRAEVGGFAAVRGILDAYVGAVLAWEAAGSAIERVPYLHQRLLLLLPDLRKPRSRYELLLHVVDYVSGMTNRFAMSQYRMLRGDAPERE